MPRRTFVRRPMVRKQAHYQWFRDTANSTAPITEGETQLKDLLSGYRTQAGIGLNLPAFTIWRIRIEVSIRLTPALAASTHIESNSGAFVGLYVDNMALVNDPAAVLLSAAQYEEKYLLYDKLYSYETLSHTLGNTSNTETGQDVALYRSYDLKGRRRLGNLGDTLILQIEPGANCIIQNYSYTFNVLSRWRD